MDYRDSDSDKKIQLSFKAKSLVLLLFSIFAAFLGNAQKKADIGIMSGISYYMGDINPSKHFYSPGILYSGFYRYNFHKRYSLKAALTYTNISGNDADFNLSNFQTERNQQFQAKVIDVSATFECNFWPYMTTLIEKDRYSPYVFAGINGFYAMGNTSSVYFGIPFGLGFKFNLTDRFGTGIEYSFRKTFTDKLDGSTPFWNEAEYFNYTKDWYSFFGVFMSYKIINKNILCPAYNE